MIIRFYTDSLSIHYDHPNIDWKYFMFSSITITIISSVFCLFLCFLFVRLFYFLLRTEPSFVFLSGEEKRKLWLNHVSPLRFPKPELQSSCPSCFVFAHFFSQCEHSFIDNPMIITAWTRSDMRKAIEPGFETISQQRVGFCQLYSKNEHIRI